MDEENGEPQRHYEYAVVRQYDLWWHDLLLHRRGGAGGGSRAWVWSDYVWQHPEAFYAKMPKWVVQSNWYYLAEFGPDLAREGIHSPR